MRTIVLLLTLPAVLQAGPYPGAAGTASSDAIPKNSPAIVAWARGHSEIIYGTDVDPEWRTPERATGPAVGDSFDIVSLGNGGRITMHFPLPIRDGAGPDFAVFENGISNTFLELAFVEVSSDGLHFHRFPSDSLTAGPVGGIGPVDPTNLSGLAGKHRQGFGTPFDLADLPAAPTLDKRHVVFVRLIDILGDGRVTDTSGDPIYDPTPTIGSGGFDLDAIGVIHQNDGPLQIVRFTRAGSGIEIEWQSTPGDRYRIETSIDLDEWFPTGTVEAEAQRGSTGTVVARPDQPAAFWRVVREAP